MSRHLAKGSLMRFVKRAARVTPLLLALGLGGCSDFLDVNTNPNAPENAPIDIRLPGLEASFIHSSYYGSVALWGSEWTQQWAFNGLARSYAEVENYELYDTDAATTWDYLYSRPGNASFTMARDASAESACKVPKNLSTGVDNALRSVRTEIDRDRDAAEHP